MEHRVLRVFAVLNQRDAQITGHITDRRDFVAGRAIGEQFALVVPHQFFAGEPAHALHKTALNLADINGRIQRRAHVMQNVGAQQAVFAGQRIHQHFTAGRAVGEVIERFAASGGAIVMDARHFVETGGRKRHLIKPRLLCNLGEGEVFLADAHDTVAEMHRVCRALMLLTQHLGKAIAQDLCGILRRFAVEIGPAGRCGWRGVGHFAGIGGGHLNLADINLQHFRHNLRHFGV